MKIQVQTRFNEKGQAAVLVVVAMAIFLLGAVGLAIDGSHLYAERQMAQAAADASAQAGIRSMFTGSNASGAAQGFSTGATFTCSASDARTPCYYAQTLNGFNSGSDTVAVSFPAASSVVPAGVLSASDPTAIRVTVRRDVPTTFFNLISTLLPSISASATAAVVSIISPTPIIVTHPSMVGALAMNGGTTITISGGPQRSIQVNSSGTYTSSGDAYQGPSSGSIDLHLSGPQSTGGDFGVFGPPTAYPGHMNLGSTGHYIGTSPPIPDPFENVNPPSVPATTPPQNGQACSVLGHCADCPAPGFVGTPPATCTEFLPGKYATLDLTGLNSAIFDPGVYYVQGGGFVLKNDTVKMCTSCAADATTVNGMVIYDTGSTAQPTHSGGFDVNTNVNAILYGAGVSTANLNAAPASPYYGILFFENRNADAHTGNGAHGAHGLGQGNGCFSVIGTMYMTNTLSIMQGDPTHYQEVRYNGTPCSSTGIVGQIIVSQLSIVGTANLNMTLYPQGFVAVRQLALVQ
ncbi:MAG: pilus assembly protein TadG-related protein [Bryobacteraceae bacterium]